MPITMMAAALAGLSMAGVLPAFGFIGKELYYEAVGHAAIAPWHSVAVVSNILLVAVVGLVCIKPFFGPKTEATGHAREAPFSLWVGPALLGLLGFVLGVLPQATAQPLVAASIASVTAEPVTLKLALWHGVNLTLLLSIFTLAGGMILYAVRNRLLLLDGLDAATSEYGPARMYQSCLDALNLAARWQTRVLQNGYLRFYLLTIIGTTIVLVWTALRNGRLPRVTLYPLDIRVYEAVLAGLILLAALVAVRSRSRLASIAGLGVVGYAVAAIFVLFGAPDLAMTQFVIETLTVILLVLVFYHLPNFKALSANRARWRDALVALTTGGTITVLLLFAITVRSHHPVSDYYLQHSVPDAHGRNIVNVILVDFRALDTLGEITVLAIAGIGVYALLKLRLARASTEAFSCNLELDDRPPGREAEQPASDGRCRRAESAEGKADDSRKVQEEIERWTP
jgi:multicomponent Na+:H+ antiporter subunit A